MSNSREIWIDTIRVISSLLVILSHFAMKFFETNTQEFFRNNFSGIGRIGVILFFAISGYLVANSLNKNDNLKVFYKHKLIRIIVPYIISYLIISIIFILMSMLKKDFLFLTPLSEIIYLDRNYFAVLAGMFPIDYNLVYLYKIGWFGLVGEWFIGTLCI